MRVLRKAACRSLNLKRSSKTYQSSLTLKGGSTSHLGLLPSGKKRKPLLLVALNHFILWLADHQRSTPAAELQFLCGDEPAFTQGFAKGLLARCFFRKPTRSSFIDKAGCTRHSSSELDSALVCTTFPLRGQGMCQPPFQ